MRRQRATDLRAAVDRLPLATRRSMLKGIEKNPIIVGADGNVRGGVCPMLAASNGSQKKIGKPFARAWDAYAGVRFSRPATDRELLTLKTMLEASIEVEVGAPVDLTAAIGSLEAAMTPSRAVERQAVPRPAERSTEPPPLDMGEAIAAHEAAMERRAAMDRRVAAESLAADRLSAEREAAERLDAERQAESQPERPDTGERDRTRELEGRHGWAWLRPVRRYDDYEQALQQLEDAERTSRSEAGDRDRPGVARSQRELAGSAARRRN